MGEEKNILNNIHEDIEKLKDKKWFGELKVRDISKIFTEKHKVGRYENKLSIKDAIETDEENIRPAKRDIFNAFKMVDNNIVEIVEPEHIKILIIGQDPYPDEGKAHGYSFSVNNGDIADSLKNIFNAVEQYSVELNIKEPKDFDFDNYYKKRANLKKWANKNSVLLLNVALTFEKARSGVKEEQEEIQTHHIKAWKPFFDEIVKNILTSEKETGDNKLVVFLWGDKARIAFHSVIKQLNANKGNENPIKKNMLVLSTSHPSNQSVNHGFKNEIIEHFRACDNFLNTRIWTREDFPEIDKSEK